MYDVINHRGYRLDVYSYGKKVRVYKKCLNNLNSNTKLVGDYSNKGNAVRAGKNYIDSIKDRGDG